MSGTIFIAAIIASVFTASLSRLIIKPPRRFSNILN